MAWEVLSSCNWYWCTSLLRNINPLSSKLPADAGQVPMKGDGNVAVIKAQPRMYWSMTASCMYMMQWSHLDIFNAVRWLASHMTAPREAHVRALMTLIEHIVSTETGGWHCCQKKSGVSDISLNTWMIRLRLHHESWWLQNHFWWEGICLWHNQSPSIVPYRNLWCYPWLM